MKRIHVGVTLLFLVLLFFSSSAISQQGEIPASTNNHPQQDTHPEQSQKVDKTANQKGSEAEYNLGEKYYYSQDYTKAVEWFLKAATQGNAISQYKLGFHYKVLEKDYAKAIVWLKKAAQQGHIEAQFELGHIFDIRAWATPDSTGIKAFHNDVEAVKWYTKAAEQGHMEAQYRLGERYDFTKYEGLGDMYDSTVEKDYDAPVKSPK